MDVPFCVSALEEALARFGKLEIFNTDQSSLAARRFSRRELGKRSRVAHIPTAATTAG
jgi:putative transposase